MVGRGFDAGPSLTEQLWRDYGRAIREASQEIGPCHDSAHAVRVAMTAEHIARREGVDPRLASLAGLAHDIGHRSGDGTDHEVLSAHWAQEQFGSFLGTEDLAVLTDAIRHRRFRNLSKTPTSITAAILDDADNLDALGAHGVARAFLWLGEHGRLEMPSDAFNDLGGVAQRDACALNSHWIEKLRHLPQLMRTEEGKRIAVSRAEYLDAFLGELYAEIGSSRP